MRILIYFMLLTFGSSIVSQSACAQQDKTEMTGKPVTLSIGPGFSLSSALIAKGVIERQGCPTTVDLDGIFPNAVDVYVGDYSDTFDDIEIAEAISIDLCKDTSE